MEQGKAYFKWKEQLIYEEGAEALKFEAPMGLTPIDVYVPTATEWKYKVPVWAQNKRDAILNVIREAPSLGTII